MEYKLKDNNKCNTNNNEVSKVYFTDFRVKNGVNLLDKLRRLMLKANIKDIDFNNKFTAIKFHFG